MGTKHYAGPWEYGEDNDGWYVSDSNCQLAFGLTEGNARRIVACVNACGDIPTELLETEHQGGKLYDALADFNQKVFELRNQRDELLRAAVAAMTIVNNAYPYGSIASDLRAAIAKAEGRS